MRLFNARSCALAITLATGACGGSDAQRSTGDGAATVDSAFGGTTASGGAAGSGSSRNGGNAGGSAAGGRMGGGSSGRAGSPADGSASTDGSTAGTLAQVCDEPAPWPIPGSSQKVGSGTATSCTADALSKAVAAGGYVTFDCGDTGTTIVLSSAIKVDSLTVIDGAGKITLDGDGKSQIFIVTSKLSVRNLRFTNGTAPASEDADGIGGAVAGSWRSAVGVWTGSTLTVVRSQFRRNHSWYGGGIYSLWSPLTIVNSEFTDNAALDDHNGGAIATDGALDPDYRNPQDGVDTVGGTVQICGTRIVNNKAKGAGGGGFLWVYPPDKIIIDRCTIEGNAVGKDNGGSGLAMGGGMRVSNGEIVITGTSLISNSAETHGGGLYLDCEPTCTITNSTFYSNQVTDGYGGAIFGDKLRVDNVTFAKNFASGHGGGLFGGSDWVFKNTVFVDNKAGNPWGQAYSCSATGKGDHVLQWVTDFKGAGSDPCISDVTAADPKLADPADNGGPTWTMLPAADSPVLGAGASCESSDQRGQARNTAVCDLGAVEIP